MNLHQKTALVCWIAAILADPIESAPIEQSAMPRPRATVEINGSSSSTSLLAKPPANDGTDDFDQEHLLIICPDFAADLLSPYVEWKRRKGLGCTLATLGEIGVSSTDDIGLKNYIQNAYDTWPNPPDFILLAGDETVLPVHYDWTDDPATMFSSASVPGWYCDENYFACLEGDDYFPDALLGRWVVNTSYEYSFLVNKLTRYEMFPNLYETSWYKKAVVAAQDSNYYQGDPSMRETKLEARDMLLGYGYAQVDTLFGQGSPYLLSQWINQGRSYLNYRGAGWTMGWAGIDFYIDMVYNLQNSFKLPVVTGIGCGVGRFDEPDGTCFGEAWILLGTMSDHRGAISFVGPGHNTHTAFNNSLDLGLYSALFEQGEPRVSAALLAGKMAMYDEFDDYFGIDPDVEEIVRVAFNQYYVLSDPELMPYTDIPQQFLVDFPPTVLLGPDSVTILVSDQAGSLYEGAQVALYLSGDFQAVGLTGADGSVTLTSDATTLPAYVYLTVTAPNHAAFLDSILVISNSQYVIHESAILDDSPAGNGDGGMSPGEQILWAETLRNYGIATAPEVHATLTSQHPLVTITQNESGFGSIEPGDSAVGAPEYGLFLEIWPYIIGDDLQFQIHIVDSMDSSWMSIVTFPLITPDLQVISLNPDPDGNGRLDRGETCELSFEVKNQGLTAVSDGTVELCSYDPYVEIVDGSIPCGPLGVNQSFSSGNTPFVVSISPYTPTLHEIAFWVRLVSEETTYLFADSSSFTFEVGEYGPTDPTSDENGTYYGYESWDSLYTEAPDFEWFEVDPEAGGPGTVLPFSASVQIQHVDLPFAFRYWGAEYDQITICADGWIMPGYTETTPPDNFNLPNVDGVSGMIAALWDNLWNPTAETGLISTYYDQVQGKFCIEYDQVSHNSSTVPKETFQIVLLDPAANPTASGDGEILFYYRTLHFFGINFSTSGLESPDETVGIEFSVNNSYPVTSHGLSDSLAIRWTPDPPLITAISSPTTRNSTATPAVITFDQPYPNPFNPSTNLRFAIPENGKVQLAVFNVRGQCVREVFRGNLNSGWHSFDFDGKGVSSGIYLARLMVEDYVAVRKLLLVK